MPNNVFGLSVSPISESLDGIMNFQKIEKEVVVGRALDSKDWVMEVQKNDDNYNSIELSEDRFIFPKGQKQYKYIYYIYPQGLEVGDYEAKFFFKITSMNEDNKGGNSVNLGMNSFINFTVTTTAFRGLSVKSIVYEKINNSVVSLDMVVENTGNVLQEIETIDLLLYETVSKKFVKNITKSIKSEIFAFSKKNFNFIIDDLPPGEYYVEAVVKDINTQQLGGSRSLSFTIGDNDNLVHKNKTGSIRENNSLEFGNIKFFLVRVYNFLLTPLGLGLVLGLLVLVISVINLFKK